MASATRLGRGTTHKHTHFSCHRHLEASLAIGIIDLLTTREVPKYLQYCGCLLQKYTPHRDPSRGLLLRY